MSDGDGKWLDVTAEDILQKAEDDTTVVLGSTGMEEAADVSNEW